MFCHRRFETISTKYSRPSHSKGEFAVLLILHSAFAPFIRHRRRSQRYIYERFSSATRPKVRDGSSRIDELLRWVTSRVAGIYSPLDCFLFCHRRFETISTKYSRSSHSKGEFAVLLILHSAFAPFIRHRRRSQRYIKKMSQWDIFSPLRCRNFFQFFIITSKLLGTHIQLTTLSPAVYRRGFYV